MYYIGLDVHKKTIRYCVKEVSGQIHSEGSVPATRAPEMWAYRRSACTQESDGPSPRATYQVSAVLLRWRFRARIRNASPIDSSRSPPG